MGTGRHQAGADAGARAERDKLAEQAQASIAAGSQSFAAAARLFDPATRRSVMMLYQWCRHCDDVIDDQTFGHRAASRSADSPEARIAALEAETLRAFAGEPVDEPSFRALQWVARDHAIPVELALEHLAGFRMDVEARRYATIEDTLDYCHHVAGVVGVMMGRVMGVDAPDVLQRAADLGLAFQLTNIARDIVPDAGVGRVYLPADWLADVGVSPGDIADPQHRAAVVRLALRLVDLAEPFYASARIGIDALPRRSAWAVATALEVYRQIGRKVVAAGEGAWDGRVSTSRRDKLGHVAQAAVGVWLRPARTPTPRPAGLWTHDSVGPDKGPLLSRAPTDRPAGNPPA